MAGGDEEVSVTISFEQVGQENIKQGASDLDQLKTSADNAATSADGLTEATGRSSYSFSTMSHSLLLVDHGLTKIGVLSGSTGQALGQLIGIMQLLTVAQRVYQAAVESETGAQWANAVARAAAWVAANPVFGAIVVGAIAAAVAAVAALKVSGALAEGGTTTMSGSYLVGERGPEIVQLGAGSTVIPLGGGGGQTVNNYNTLVGDPEMWDRKLRQIMDA